MKLLEDKRVTVFVVALVIGALVAALWAPIDGTLKAELVTAIAVVGVALAGALRGVAPKLLPLGLALALSASLGGCGSALRTHATIASTAGASLDAWCQGDVASREREMRAAVAAHQYREEAAAAVAEIRAAHEPAIAGCTVAKGVHDGWVGALSLGAAGAPFDAIDVARRFVGPLVEVWSGIASATARSDHPLPPPPEALVVLAEGVSP